MSVCPTLLVHDGLARLEEQLVAHGHIDLAVLLANRQLVAAEAKQGVLHTIEQTLHLLVLLSYHVLQLGYRPLAVLQVRIELLVLVLTRCQLRLQAADATLEQSRVGHQSIHTLVVHGTVVAADAEQVGQTVATVESSQATRLGYLILLLAYNTR